MFYNDEFGSPLRLRVLYGVIILIFVLLMLRLYQLQMLYHGELDKKSEENSVRAIAKDPIRGYIYDRNGKLIVDVGPSYSVTITPIDFDKRNLNLLASILQMDPQVIEERMSRGHAYSPFLPTRIKRDIDFQTLAAMEEHLTLLPGVDYIVESKRIYPTRARAPHLLGYSREVSDAQLGQVGEFYRQGDLIGTAGLEASYESLLRGEKGFQFVSVNSRGQVIGEYEHGRRDILSREGFDLILSVDIGIQAFAESLMTDYRGALVAMDPNTGGVLALVSKPDFDPSLMSGVTPAELWAQLNSDPNKPLFNRATMTRYPPGSTFKMVLAAAALQEGIIDERYRITCTGAFHFGNRIFKDLHVHGSVNVVEAIQKSCNVFFYQLMLKVGLDKFSEYAHKFGFGSPTGIDIGEETAGLIPSAAYFDRVYGKGKWTQGYLVSLGIGQGEVGVSPLQMACYATALASGGIFHQPRAVNYISNKRTNKIEELDHHSNEIGIEPEVMSLLREGMRRVVQEAGGTGALARIPGVVSGGKTGTAENPHGEDHAWYIGFAPFDEPKIAVAVMLENAGFGGSKAAPIAEKVMEKYLFGELRPNTPRPAPTEPARKDSTVKVTHAIVE